MALICIKIFLLFCYFQLFVVCEIEELAEEANDCAQIFVVPIFSKNYMKFYQEHIAVGPSIMSILVGHCTSHAFNFRRVTRVFDFANNLTLTCISSDSAPCFKSFIYHPTGILNDTNYYSIRKNLEKEITEQGCITNSVLLFVTDVPCQSLYKYPDINELFGPETINKTINFLNKNKILTYLLWIDDITCDYINELKHNYSNYFEMKPIRAGIELATSAEEVCLKEIPKKIKPRKTDEISKALEQGLIIGSSTIFGLIVLFVAFWSRQIYRRWQESKIEAFANEHVKSARHLLFGKYMDQWEVTPKELKVDAGMVLGKGAFGVVYKGFLKKKRNNEWLELYVAVKFTTEHSTEQMRQDMISEIGFMKALGSHENLLTMVGYVKSIENPVICTVLCSEGDLLNVLKKHPLHFMSKEKCTNVEICLLLPDLLRIAIEICNGLCYLASFNYVHRDIAARNVLLTDQMVAKLSDFGLCKKLELGEICIIDKNGKFPVKHMPHESLKFGEFNEKSDVWSFGILIWEMFSGGESPFKEIHINDFVAFLEQNGKPEFSQETPQPLVQFLNNSIFQMYPSRRANFKEIKQELSDFYSVVLSVVKKINSLIKNYFPL